MAKSETRKVIFESRKRETIVIPLEEEFRVRAIGRLADDINMGILLDFKVHGQRNTIGTCILPEDHARLLAKKLLKAADKIKE